MQFKNPNTKNWLKLKKIVKNKRCHICHHPLLKTGVYMWDTTKKDCNGLKCFNCLTIYSTSFEIKEMGIPTAVGYS